MRSPSESDPARSGPGSVRGARLASSAGLAPGGGGGSGIVVDRGVMIRQRRTMGHAQAAAFEVSRCESGGAGGRKESNSSAAAGGCSGSHNGPQRQPRRSSPPPQSQSARRGQPLHGAGFVLAWSCPRACVCVGDGLGQRRQSAAEGRPDGGRSLSQSLSPWRRRRRAEIASTAHECTPIALRCHFAGAVNRRDRSAAE